MKKVYKSLFDLESDMKNSGFEGDYIVTKYGDVDGDEYHVELNNWIGWKASKDDGFYSYKKSETKSEKISRIRNEKLDELLRP